MLYQFCRAHRDAPRLDHAELDGLPADLAWFDLHEPTPEEIRAVERTLGVEMPTRDEMRDIEASARVYEENEAIYMTATVLFRSDQLPPKTTEITFVLKGEHLVTMRFADPQPFRTLSAKLERQGPGLGSGPAAFFWLMDGLIARVADVMERVALDLDALSGEIFGAARRPNDRERPDLVEALERIGRNGDAISKASESLHTFHRILLVMGTTDVLPQGQRKDARQRAKALNRDVLSLTDQIGRINTKIDLLLNATLGLINIEQNAIIKIFSVVAVVFLPPTLIASIYGMNFEFMPELAWPIGYPIAIALMVLSAALPIAYFKRKGWL